jgi:hypothetical protein
MVFERHSAKKEALVEKKKKATPLEKHGLIAKEVKMSQ